MCSESWHFVEHIVIIRNAISNGGGCPCPGIGDRALDVTDTQLHFVYNLLAYAGTLAPFPTVRRVPAVPQAPPHRALTERCDLLLTVR